MKQILQRLSNGETRLEDIPAPRAARGEVLIQTNASLISAGTERMLVDFGKANLVDKARQQPDKVKEVLQKVRTDGIAATLDAVQSKLDQPLALGYCNAGRVLEIGTDVEGFAIGDRVASNGKHAEVVAVAKNLCAKIPQNVSDEAAAFTVLAAVGLQGVRLADPKIGECVAVIGLGLIGLLTVQMLRAQGCRVLGLDLDDARLDLARSFGAETIKSTTDEDTLACAMAFSRGVGIDAVIITASSKSNALVSLAAKMSRKRGRIVLVGVVGLELRRADFYEKELTFQVSCSYGPGRYDPKYEDGGQDYPIGFVRWTEQRNFEAVLDLMSSGGLDVSPLISHRFALDDAANAFALLTSEEPSLGILLEYGQSGDSEKLTHRTITLASSPPPAKASVAFIGSGNYAGRVLIPAFKAAGASLKTVVSGGGVSAVHFGAKFAFSTASTDIDSALADASIDTVVIATRHEAHAAQALAALRAGKNVFCEKPLCLTLEDLEAIKAECELRPHQHLMVGFNRRFAPLTLKVKDLLGAVTEPKAFIMTVNAGAVPSSHWTQDANIGGGRIIGEACHFIDLLRHLAGSQIVTWSAMRLGENAGSQKNDDKASISLTFADGSSGVVHYLANGHKSFPKERLEVFAGGRILQLDNFRTLRGWGWRGFYKSRALRQDKGQKHCAKAFVDAIKTGSASPIPIAEIMEVSQVTIEAAKSLRS